MDLYNRRRPTCGISQGLVGSRRQQTEEPSGGAAGIFRRVLPRTRDHADSRDRGLCFTCCPRWRPEPRILPG